MRFSFPYFLLVFFALASSAQSKDFKLLYKNGKVGLTDESGTVLIPATYEALGWSNGQESPKDELIGFKKNGNWGLLSLQNEIIVSNTFSKLYPAGQGFFIASKKGKYSQQDFLGLINSSGKEIIPFKYSAIELVGSQAIVGVKSVRNYQYGLVEFGGKIIIPIEFRDIQSLGDDKFAVKNTKGKYSIYDSEGRPTVGMALDSISAYKNERAIIYTNHSQGIIDKRGNVLAAPDFKTVRLEDPIELLPFDSWSIIKDKKERVSWNYDIILTDGDDSYRVSANTKQWVVDRDNIPLTSKTYSRITEEKNSIRLFETNNKWGALKKGEIIIKPKFDSLTFLNDNIHAFDGSNWFLYDVFGIEKSNRRYDEMGAGDKYYIPVKKNGKWGFLNKEGEEVIHCVYQDISQMMFNKVVVKFHDNFGIIDKYGDWLVLPQKDKVQLINNDLYLSYRKGLTVLKSFDDETIYFTENKVEIKDDHLLEYLTHGGLWKISFSGRIVNRELPQQKFQEIRASSEGLFAVKVNNRYGFVDDQNRLIVANRYEDVGDFSEGLVSIKLLGKWGYIDNQENIVVQPNYEVASPFKNGVAIVKSDQGFGLIDSDGKKVSAFGYDEIVLMPDGKYKVRENGKYGLLNSTGIRLINAKYDQLEELPNGFIKVSLFRKYGVLNHQGVDIIPIIYDDILYDARFNEYLAMKKSNWEKLSDQ